MKERKDRRRHSYAKVLIDGRQPAYIRDISTGGFRVYSPMPLSQEEGSSVRCQIIPEDPGESSFEITGEVRWNRLEAEGDDIMGFWSVRSPRRRGKNSFPPCWSVLQKTAATVNRAELCLTDVPG